MCLESLGTPREASSATILTVVDILEAAAAAVLHADPELIPAEVGAEVGDDVGVAAVLQDRETMTKTSSDEFRHAKTQSMGVCGNYLHHEDLLLDDAKVVALLQLDHLDGRELAGRDAF